MRLTDTVIAVIRGNKILKKKLLENNNISRSTLYNWLNYSGDNNFLLLPKNIDIIKKYSNLEENQIIDRLNK